MKIVYDKERNIIAYSQLHGEVNGFTYHSHSILYQAKNHSQWEKYSLLRNNSIKTVPFVLHKTRALYILTIY